MAEPIFRLSYRIIYGDTDAGSVVYNANYLRFFEMGRTEMMRSCSIPYRRIEDQGLIIPVTETYLRFKAPARYDDLITIETSLADMKKYSCRFNYRITRNEQKVKEKLLAKGFTTHACVDRQGKLTPFPNELKEAMAALFDNDKTVPTSP